MDHQRRAVLKMNLAAGVALATGGIFASRVSFAAQATNNNRFVFVLLRGALDGLAAAPPVGDPDYGRLRGNLGLAGADSLHTLDGMYALHPALTFLAEQWQAKQLALLHAVATPYRERSHFDAQDVLESGYARPHASRSGWLNRALTCLPQAAKRSSTNVGVTLGANIPLVMRGPTEVASWAPSSMPDVDADTLQRIGDLYAADPLLSRRLADALAANETAGMDGMATAGRGYAAQIAATAKATAGFLAQEDGPRVAVFETTGWDTHANQGADKGALALRLGLLDAGLRALHDSLGPVWDDTVVLVATEFGRTVAVNGTRGTDHGTGAAAFLLGGAVKGGRVIAQWPGLAESDLYESRDLKPTTDLRAVMKGVLRDHLGIAPRLLEAEVFPDSATAPAMAGLV
jgi:uncharacterized protein (DUF1501 family)